MLWRSWVLLIAASNAMPTLVPVDAWQRTLHVLPLRPFFLWAPTEEPSGISETWTRKRRQQPLSSRARAAPRHHASKQELGLGVERAGRRGGTRCAVASARSCSCRAPRSTGSRKANRSERARAVRPSTVTGSASPRSSSCTSSARTPRPVPYRPGRSRDRMAPRPWRSLRGDRRGAGDTGEVIWLGFQAVDRGSPATVRVRIDEPQPIDAISGEAWDGNLSEDRSAQLPRLPPQTRTSPAGRFPAVAACSEATNSSGSRCSRGAMRRSASPSSSCAPPSSLASPAGSSPLDPDAAFTGGASRDSSPTAGPRRSGCVGPLGRRHR